jgi:hypothetical protein
MRISYKAIIKLLKTHYTVYTKDEFIKAFQGVIDSAIDTGKELEDYEFLSVMTGENEKYDNYIVAFNEDNISIEHPIVIEQNKDLSLFGFAKLYYDSPAIKKELFYKVLEKEALRQDMEPTSIILQFDYYIGKLGKSIQDARAGYEKKIGRNETCPCGSGKKYKTCCGSPPITKISVN